MSTKKPDHPLFFSLDDPIIDDSYLKKVHAHSKNTNDFTHYKIKYTYEEKVKCDDEGTHPMVYYTVPKGGSVTCGYCNRKWIRKLVR